MNNKKVDEMKFARMNGLEVDEIRKWKNYKRNIKESKRLRNNIASLKWKIIYFKKIKEIICYNIFNIYVELK